MKQCPTTSVWNILQHCVLYSVIKYTPFWKVMKLSFSKLEHPLNGLTVGE